MTGPDPSLSELLEQFSAMAPESRAEVLASLNEDECARLLPMLSEGSQAALSPALSALVGLCRINAARSVTQRVSAILAEAVPSGVIGQARLAAAADERPGAWDRFAARWRRPA